MQNQDPYLEALDLADSGGAAAEVLRLLHDACKNGDDRAKYALATWYLHGADGVLESDLSKAMVLLSELENANIAEALFDLAFAYDTGAGRPQDEAKAFSLYMRAALLGDTQACDQIAQFYREGRTVAADDALAKAWQQRSKIGESGISPPYRQWLRPIIGSPT